MFGNKFWRLGSLMWPFAPHTTTRKQLMYTEPINNLPFTVRVIFSGEGTFPRGVPFIFGTRSIGLARGVPCVVPLWFGHCRQVEGCCLKQSIAKHVKRIPIARAFNWSVLSPYSLNNKALVQCKEGMLVEKETVDRSTALSHAREKAIIGEGQSPTYFTINIHRGKWVIPVMQVNRLRNSWVR